MSLLTHGSSPRRAAHCGEQNPDALSLWTANIIVGVSPHTTQASFVIPFILLCLSYSAPTITSRAFLVHSLSIVMQISEP
jgi:hypothetical protein